MSELILPPIQEINRDGYVMYECAAEGCTASSCPCDLMIVAENRVLPFCSPECMAAWTFTYAVEERAANVYRIAANHLKELMSP